MYSKEDSVLHEKKGSLLCPNLPSFLVKYSKISKCKSMNPRFFHEFYSSGINVTHIRLRKKTVEN